MDRKKIIGIFSQKIQLKNVSEIRLSDGKIEKNFFKSVIKQIVDRCRKSEFVSYSKQANNWRDDVPIGKFADLLSCENPRQAAILRAKILAPKPSRETVLSYIADIVEKKVSDLPETLPIRRLTLPLCGHEEKSYITTIKLIERAFNLQIPNETVEEGKIADLLQCL